MPRTVVAVAVLVAACKEGAPGQRGGASELAGNVGASLGAAAPASATTPAAARAPSPELLTDDLYRAPGGGALFRFPAASVMGRSWTRRTRKDGAVMVVQLAHTDGLRRAHVEVRFPPHQATAVAARTLAEAAAAEITKQMVGAKVLGGRELPLPGGAGWGIGAETTLAGARVVIGVVAVTDGGDAVLVTTIAHAELYDAPAVRPVLDAVYAGISVGGKIARAPSLSPPTPLSGVFVRIGPALGEVHLFQFDARGWVLADEQVGTVDTDLAYATGKLARYTVSGDEIRVAEPGGKVTAMRRDGSDLALDGHTYCRAAATDGLTLSGRWESPTFVNTTGPTGETFTASASSSFVFAADGTYRDASSVSATLSQPSSPGRPATPTVTGGGRDSGTGRYRIAGDRLELTRDGTTASLPFYARACDGTPSLAVLVIDGTLYLRDD